MENQNRRATEVDLQPKVFFDPKSGHIFFCNKYEHIGGNKYRIVEKTDITQELNKVLWTVLDKAKLEIKRTRISDNQLKIICLCGSTRFKDIFHKILKELTLEGHIVLIPGSFPHAEEGVSPEDLLGVDRKQMLDMLHRRKIDLSDIVFFINKDGYMGESTMAEYEYAIYHKKLILWYDNVEGKKTAENVKNAQSIMLDI